MGFLNRSTIILLSLILHDVSRNGREVPVQHGHGGITSGLSLGGEEEDGVVWFIVNLIVG